MGAKINGNQSNKLEICGVKFCGKGEVERMSRRGKMRPATDHIWPLLGIWASSKDSGLDGRVLAGW